MLSSQRHELILSELAVKGHVTVMELRELLNVSVDTVRRDLEQLERQHKLQRVHGGATALIEAATNQTFVRRNISFMERKRELAKVAVQLVEERQAVALNSGTTNIEVAKQLAERFERLTVITNSLKVADCLAGKRGFTVIVPGGVLDHDEFSLHGRSIAAEIAGFNPDIAFININAVSLDKALTDFRQGEKEVILAMIRSAGKTFVTADSSKFETTSYINVCGFDQIDSIVTDSLLDERIRQSYEARGIVFHTP